jgi:hypothetical protein
MDDLSTSMPKHDKHEQNPECGGRNREKIDCNHIHHVVFQEHLDRRIKSDLTITKI